MDETNMQRRRIVLASAVESVAGSTQGLPREALPAYLATCLTGAAMTAQVIADSPEFDREAFREMLLGPLPELAGLLDAVMDQKDAFLVAGPDGRLQLLDIEKGAN